MFTDIPIIIYDIDGVRAETGFDINSNGIIIAFKYLFIEKIPTL